MPRKSSKSRAPDKPARPAAGVISAFLETHYRHFNSGTLVDAAKAYRKQMDDGNWMMVTLGGAMSTAELGRSLAEMIRQNKVQVICCTGANLEEDIFNLVAHKFYRRIPEWRDLSPKDEELTPPPASQPGDRHLHS